MKKELIYLNYNKQKFMYKTKTHINFFDADSAGILFFGKAFEYFHAAYEAFLKQLQPQENYFNHAGYAIPIKKAEAEYFLPVYPGEEIILEISVDEVRSSSFALSCTFRGSDDEIRIITKTVHVFIDKRTGAKTGIPHNLKAKLNEHLLR